MSTDWTKVGEVYVDSGTIAVGDPCYVNGRDASSGAKDWNDFLVKTWPLTFGKPRGKVDEAARNAEMNVANVMGKEGVGIVVSSGYGDGRYPVYIRKNSEGRIMGVMVDFEDAGWDGGDDPYGLDEGEDE